MIKRILSILLIAMLLMLAGAQAEETAYIPGETSLALFSEAFEQGDMILMDMSVQLTTNENFSVLFGEDAELLSAISKALPQTTLTMGLARLGNGVRLLFGGQYATDDQAAVVDLLVDLTADGVTIISSSIPGERLTARWETLLTLCGVGAEEAAQILSLRDTDWEAMIAEMAAQLAPMIELTAQIAKPYGNTIASHIAALPTEVRTNVPAENGFPAAASEVCFLITQKAIGDLITDLASQLEADATLCALLDAALAQSGESLTTAQLCQAVKASAAESLTDESAPLHVYIGMDEADQFLYTSASSPVEGAPMFSLVCAPHEDTGLSMISIDYLTLNAEGNPQDGFSAAALYQPTPTESSTLDLQLYLEAYEDETVILAVESAFAEGGATTEDGLPAHAGYYAINLAADDSGEIVSMSIASESVQAATAEGGEASRFDAALEMSAGEVSIPVTYEISSVTVPGESGPVSSVSSLLSAPMLGVDSYTESCMLYTAAYELNVDGLTETALETASEAELEALASRAAASIQETLNTLMTLLPPELTALMQ